MSELAAFAARLRAAVATPAGPASHLFDARRPVVVARAPGRLDVMGGIADYSGSLVLQLPIREATWAAVQTAEHEQIRVVSLGVGPASSARSFAMPLDRLDALATAGYAALREAMAESPDDHWAAYVVGVVAVLRREKGVRPQGGLDVLIASDVPEGKGVSSSAALEVATMRALAALLRVPLDEVAQARLAQVVENYVVGAPCGIMDQMASSLGRERHLLALHCQPAEVEGFVPIPPGVAFWGIDSGIRHAVSGSDYTSVRTGAFMGYRMLADALGVTLGPSVIEGVLAVDPARRGYLANLDPEHFERELAGLLPESLSGAEFLARYGGTTDPVTRVDPARVYPVRVPTRHPVHENARVSAFRDRLTGPISEPALIDMGRWMAESHASYSACGLGSEGTDLLVELVREAGESAGLYGAKITGGGSGGTVAILGRAGADAGVEAVAARYAARTGRVPYIFSGSSPGSWAYGVHELGLPTRSNS